MSHASRSRRRVARAHGLVVGATMLVSFAVALISGPATAHAEPQYWSAYALRMLDRPAVRMGLDFEARLDEGLLSNGLYLAGWSLGRHLSPDMETVMTARYLGKARQDGPFSHTYRLELELNPRLMLSERTSVHLRNRIELAAEGHSLAGVRARHRLRVVHALPPGAVFDRVFFGYEIFYGQEISRQEIVPTGVRLRIADGVTLSLLYLVHLNDSNAGIIGHVVSSRISYTP